jgi:hypothetical protein
MNSNRRLHSPQHHKLNLFTTKKQKMDFESLEEGIRQPEVETKKERSNDEYSAPKPKTVEEAREEFQSMSKNYLIGRKAFVTKDLMKEFPLELYNQNKILLNNIIDETDPNHGRISPELHVARWNQMKTEKFFWLRDPKSKDLISPSDDLFVCRENVFDYQKEKDLPEEVCENVWVTKLKLFICRIRLNGGLTLHILFYLWHMEVDYLLKMKCK